MLVEAKIERRLRRGSWRRGGQMKKKIKITQKMEQGH
jgi:hypothetical protein